MERRSHRQFFGLTLALLALAGLVALASVALLAAEVRADAFELPAWSQILKASKRFQLVMGGAAVLDKETGLVWEQSPGETDGTAGITAADAVTWFIAREERGCGDKNVGGRKGWRLPSFEELASLIDLSAPGTVKLPVGNPFVGVQAAGNYWSATTSATDTSQAWGVDFDEDHEIETFAKTATSFIWCARGDGPLSEL